MAALPSADGSLTYFETDSADVSAGQATARILPTLTTISDGTNSGIPFTRYVHETDGWHGYSQFTLQRTDGSIANMNWDRSEQGSGPITVLDPVGTLVNYTPAAGDLAYPVNMVQQPGGQPERAATAPALDPTKPWTVSDAAIPDGSTRLRRAAGVGRLWRHRRLARRLHHDREVMDVRRPATGGHQLSVRSGWCLQLALRSLGRTSEHG